MYDITGAVSLWDHLAETSKPIIIYGMGDGAQKILDVCSLKNVKISGFMASDDFVRGHSFAGFEVKKLSDIERQVIQRIIAISDRHELYAPDVPVIGGGLFTKEYAEEHRAELERVYSMLADEKSKQVFDGWLEYRITGRIQPLLRNQTDKAEGYEILDLGGNLRAALAHRCLHGNHGVPARRARKLLCRRQRNIQRRCKILIGCD